LEFKLKLPPELSAPLTIACHKRMADLHKMTIVVDPLRDEFADLMKSPRH
jgi:hypothetical protein